MTAVEIIGLVIKWLVPFLCGAVVSVLVSKWKLIKALFDAVQCLLRDRIIHNHDKYMERGFCPIYAKESIKRMYKPYHALGGNDVATRLYEEIMELPSEAPKNN